MIRLNLLWHQIERIQSFSQLQSIKFTSSFTSSQSYKEDEDIASNDHFRLIASFLHPIYLIITITRRISTGNTIRYSLNLLSFSRTSLFRIIKAGE